MMKMLSTKNIIKRRKDTLSKLDELYKYLKDLTERCSHHNLRYRDDGTSGNYDGYESYWRDWFCPDCGKRWSTNYKSDQYRTELDRYPKANRVCRYNNPKEYKNFFSED